MDYEEETKSAKATLNHTFATIGLGMLFIWWGAVVIVDPLTISVGAIGTGLILLGINAARFLKGIPTYGSTTAIGVIALVWGVLDTVFNLRVALSFAILLIVIGVVVIGSLVSRSKTA